MTDVFFPSEWHEQSLVQLTWPHAGTDWAYMLDEVDECFVNMTREIAAREPLLIVTPEPERIKQLINETIDEKTITNITFHECPTNDTWARDHGFITMLSDRGPRFLDFRFNGWGGKFEAELDNRINRSIYEAGIINGEYEDHLDFVFEGGSIESDGRGTLLTTTECLLSKGRNEHMDKESIDKFLRRTLHADRVLWLDHGYLAGDDTDSHIDTLARLCPNDTITYVKCTDKSDEHYESLQLMEAQLQTFRTASGQPFRLIALPMANAVHTILPDTGEEERLPATYANFLIMNGAVLMPTYRQPEKDKEAAIALAKAFPHHEIVGIDCIALIKQHGSLHCSTMQFPAYK